MARGPPFPQEDGRWKKKSGMTCNKARRKYLSADFNTLKTKGHKPFYRGLKFRLADKMCTCKRNGANTAPVAQA